jgi:hypothetical protein
MDDYDHNRSSAGGIILIIVVAVLILLGAGGGGMFLLMQARQSRLHAEREAMLANMDARLSTQEQQDRLVAEKARAAKEEPKPQPAADPLEDLNQSFRAAYKTLRLETIAKSSPVVVVDGDNLVLYRDRQRQVSGAVPKSYHELKAIAHVPLALFLMTRSTDRQLDQARLDELDAYLAKLNALSQERGQEPIIAESLHFARLTLEAKSVTLAARQTFARKMAPLVLAIAAQAANVQIDGYQRTMQDWKKTMSADEWNRLKVVVMGSQMPRQGHIAVQYFAWLLNEPGEGKRIIYSEGIFDEQKALGLMATREIDTDIGVAFFNEERRMHRDLLADAATEILKKMKP